MSRLPLRLLPSTLFAAVALVSFASAQGTYNAYNDFYLSPTATGWDGATTPSAAGAAWGYYNANVNGFGFPNQIGFYFTPTASGSGTQNLYQFSSVAPIGAGTYVGASGWAATGGTGFPFYSDTFEWGSSLGRYETPWFPGAPGLSQGLTNLIWFQPGWLSSATNEGIAPVLTWKAPQTGVYTFSGLFVAANQSSNGASVAIVDSLNEVSLSRTSLSPNTTQSFSFTKSYAAGDVVQFQVGSDFKTGNAVGLQVNISPATTNVVLTLQTSTNLSGQWQNTPITSNMITPAGDLNVGSLTNTNTFYRLKIRTVVE
jgi:hypothetical protein